MKYFSGLLGKDGNWDYLLIGSTFLVWGDRNVMKLDSSGVYTTVEYIRNH
jgi:hypothetical protein